jgi:hypothetical protein
VSADLQLPRGKSLESLFQWAQAAVNTLRRLNTSVTERVVIVETHVEEVETDDELTLDALAAYAADVQQFIIDADNYAQDIYDEYAAAAAAGHARLASHYLTEAASRVEQYVRIEEDEVLAGQITTVSASLATTAASLTTEITARVTGDEALASSISTVQTQANGNSASISTLTTSVNGISARWGVSVNINGQVAGLVQLDGTASGSNFTVVANRFIISHPTSSGTLITPFVVGLVNGISTVGIAGNLVIDGTIIARHIAAGAIDATRINVASLSSIAADIGTVTAGVLRSSDGNFVIDLNNKTITITT